MIAAITCSLCLISCSNAYPSSSTPNIVTTSTPDNQSHVSLFSLVLAGIALISIFLIIGKCCFQLFWKSRTSFPFGYREMGSNLISDDINQITDHPSGLRNISETCYVNSMIQATASSNALIRECQEIIDRCEASQRCDLLKFFVKLLNEINDPSDRRNCVNTNTENLRQLMIRSDWKAKSQQDSFHLLSSVIKAIQEDSVNVLATQEKIMPPKMNILHKFSENNKYNKVQQYLALALPLCGNFKDPDGVDLSELIDSFFSASVIDDTINTTQLFLYSKVPNVLILHIQAKEWDYNMGTYIKPTYYIKFGETFSYRFHVAMTIDGAEMRTLEVTFQLVAVVHHMGGTKGGHYVTYRRHRDNWYLTNDTQVSRSALTSNIIPYIMVYDKLYETEIPTEI